MNNDSAATEKDAPSLIYKPKPLKKVVYSATNSEQEFNYFADAFSKMDVGEIQKVLDEWFNQSRISISERDVMKGNI